jgi:hypothetical protein
MHVRNKSIEDLVVFSNSRAELPLTLQDQRPHCTEVLLYGWYNVFSRIACYLLCQGSPLELDSLAIPFNRALPYKQPSSGGPFPSQHLSPPQPGVDVFD